MQPVLSVAEVRAAEQAALRHLPAGTLLALASRAAAVRAGKMLGFSYGARVLLVVGSGDNGADALFAGAWLAGRGAVVRAVLADPDRVHGAALAALRGAGGRTVELSQVDSADLIVDGLLGIGASGPVRQSYLPPVELANRLPAPVLAVDIASGVDPSTGAVHGPAVRADVTLCMGALKPGLVIADGPRYCGEVVVVDLGLQLPMARELPGLWQLDGDDVRAALRRPDADDNKYSRGVVGVVAGSDRYPGAAQLAVGSALLGGVGAVRYAGSAAQAVVTRWPEVLVTDTAAEAGRVQAWAVGPGMGDNDGAVRELEYVLGQDVPVIVDADGLSLLATRRGLLTARTAPTVLTPHSGEFARVFPELGGDALAADRLAAVRRASVESGAVVLLKGSATIVARPDGTAYVNPVAAPVLATAGSGDVLTGLIGSLLATGIEPALAAAMGAYLHAQAGRRAAEDGPVIAMDLVPALRRVLADLL